MYLVAIAWLYVALMMAVAEATHAQGSVLGAIVTFVLYGLAPIALVMYLLGTPMRRRARREAEARERAEALAASTDAAMVPGADGSPVSTAQQDAGGLPAGDAVAPERKVP
jgi:hypothetical protein